VAYAKPSKLFGEKGSQILYAAQQRKGKECHKLNNVEGSPEYSGPQLYVIFDAQRGGGVGGGAAPPARIPAFSTTAAGWGAADFSTGKNRKLTEEAGYLLGKNAPSVVGKRSVIPENREGRNVSSY